jgi:hypothetical protein
MNIIMMDCLIMIDGNIMIIVIVPTIVDDGIVDVD